MCWAVAGLALHRRPGLRFERAPKVLPGPQTEHANVEFPRKATRIVACCSHLESGWDF
jgi:hypothetical protein